MTEAIGNENTSSSRRLNPLQKVVGKFCTQLTSAYIKHKEPLFRTVESSDGHINGTYYNIYATHATDSAIGYAIGGKSLPGIEASFCFKPEGNWTFERAHQEILFDPELAITHTASSIDTPGIREMWQVAKSCHFILSRSVSAS